MQFIDLQAQYQELKSNIDRRIQTVLNHGKYILGPEVQELEEALNQYVNVEHTITCANGTDALQLALMTMDIGPGDIVFCPTFTFFASAEVISLVGATPVFVDVDSQTFNLCPEALEKSIVNVLTSSKLKPKAIISVDLFGLPADYPKLKKIAKQYDLKIIEDSAQGFGGKIDGQLAGSFGDIATTSFFPAKPLGCYGDGGAVFTNNEDYANILKSLRVHGKGQDKYDNIRIGLNSRLDTIQAAVLLEKLKVFPAELARKEAIANQYSTLFGDAMVTPYIPKGYQSAWAQFTVKTTQRDKFIKKLNLAGIPAMIYYQTCMHQQQAFDNKVVINNAFPVAELLAQQVMSLPMHAYLKDQDIENIAEILISS
ncbi:DegT/DnrJ/EryC1/StrS family aminotransferase [Candidatus Colwellia aromaticivorans]|uniref:DegT/DnrJ/EryC1/StrS family aminotransferase n=1 Tax=Candidatus Colwellia aromaticivorans TaxID=2267621 RepID=UPI000DF2C317|nr:DegT/DnrJ/EryC1/StrS family aminotransferase [Candidatus Colwellia aromaticivorans]